MHVLFKIQKQKKTVSGVCFVNLIEREKYSCVVQCYVNPLKPSGFFTYHQV